MFSKVAAAATAGIFALLLTGCSDKEPSIPDALAECIVDGVEAPKWVCGIEAAPEGTLTAVGAEPFRRLGDAFARREALAHARDKLFKTIASDVYANIRHLARTLGEKAGSTADRFAEEIAEEVARESIGSARQIKLWKQPRDMSVYVLLAVSRYHVNDKARKALLIRYKSNDLFYREFKEADGPDRLEEQFSIH